MRTTLAPCGQKYSQMAVKLFPHPFLLKLVLHRGHCFSAPQRKGEITVVETGEGSVYILLAVQGVVDTQPQFPSLGWRIEQLGIGKENGVVFPLRCLQQRVILLPRRFCPSILNWFIVSPL